MSNPILLVFENAGLALLEADQAQIEAAAANVADETVVKVASAIEAALPTGGLAGLVDGEIKTILTGAEPELEAAAGAEIDALYGDLETAIKNAIAAQEGGGSSAPPSGAAPAAEGHMPAEGTGH